MQQLHIFHALAGPSSSEIPPRLLPKTDRDGLSNPVLHSPQSSGGLAVPEEWKPDLLDTRRAASVRGALQDILASDAFKGGKRAQDFLQLIVEHALACRFDSLRERMLGAEMFGRPVGYDTANDAVVRVKATEVRKRLA